MYPITEEWYNVDWWNVVFEPISLSATPITLTELVSLISPTQVALVHQVCITGQVWVCLELSDYLQLPFTAEVSNFADCLDKVWFLGDSDTKLPASLVSRHSQAGVEKELFLLFLPPGLPSACVRGYLPAWCPLSFVRCTLVPSTLGSTWWPTCWDRTVPMACLGCSRETTLRRSEVCLPFQSTLPRTSSLGRPCGQSKWL